MPLLVPKREKKEQNRDPNCESLLAISIPDQTGLATADPVHWNQLWNSFDRYYSENEKAIMEASQLDVQEIATSRKGIQKEAITTSFLEHSKTILNGLQFLSEIHPAISVVVGAFSSVIKIELIRRDNNMKAMSVKIQMQNLMCALFQLRLLRTEEHDYMTSQRVAHMMSIIAEEIKACGSDLSYYQDKKLISRLLHAQFFEQRLAQHIATFAERRSELQLLFTSYTAGQVHETTAIASRIECKVDNLVNLLHRFDSPREKDATKFIENNGGIEHCVYDKTLLTELMSKTGDTVREDGDIGQKGGDDSTSNFMKQLQKELKEDVEEVLNKNMANFEAMLRIQNNNLQHMSHLMENQTSQIMKIHNEIAMIFPGIRKHVLLTDPMLQKIWMEMGLRQSVKAKKFVLTFKDYHTRMTAKTPMIMAVSPNIPILELPPSANLDGGLSGEKASFTTGGEGAKSEDVDDDWALHYIDVVHLDPLVEAIDDDFSGFISIHEANRFAVARPKNWSLLRWFAYWAAGWALSVKRYKGKLLDLVQQIYLARLNVLPCNMAFVTDYIDGSAFKSLDTLLRSTQPFLGDHDSTDNKLTSLVTEFDEELEGRLLANLKDLKFNLSSVDKVTLVSGPGRIERFALPLIHLLLKHHLSVVRLAGHYRVCSEEMAAASVSLLMVLNSLRARAEKLEAVFRQKSRPIQDQFKKYSFGMLELFNSPAEYQDVNNAMLDSYWENSGNTESSDGDGSLEATEGTGAESSSSAEATKSKSLPTETDLDALKMFSQQLDHPEDQPVVLEQVLIHDFTSPSSTKGDNACSIAGGWTTRAYRDRGLAVMQRDLIVMRFDDPGPTGMELTGAGEGFPGSGKITGTIERGMQRTGGEDGEDDVQKSEGSEGIEITTLDFTMPYPSGLISHYRVTPADGSDGMHWKGEWWFDDYEEDKGVRPCDMFRAPPEALRYRHILEESSGIDIKPQTQPTLVEQPVPSGEEVQAHEPANATPEDRPSERTPAGTPPNEVPTRSSLAVARWKYAGEAILYQVRQKLHSGSFYRERAKERRRYILITMKLSHAEQTDAEYSELLTIRARVHPNICYTWNRIALFYSDRKVAEHVTSYLWCDYCSNRFCFTRHFCITCQLPSLMNQIDICTLCLNKNTPITTGEFTHDPSHTLFKTNRRILDMEKAHLVSQARIRSKRVKQLFRGEDSETQHHGKGSEAPKGPAPKCTHCSQEVSLPCWVCTICPQDTYICMKCETGLQHDQCHALLRIFNNVEEEETVTTEVERYYNRAKVALAEELGTLETKVTQRMEALAAQVDKIQQGTLACPPATTASPARITARSSAVPGEEDDAAISSRMDKLEKDVSSRLTALEGILLRVLEAVEARR